MLKRVIIILCIYFLLNDFGIAYCQVAPGKYWISFKDKNNSPYSPDRPEEFLSERSILRRSRQKIAFNELDIPVNPSYIDSIQMLGLQIFNVSKWLNGVLISSNDTSLLNKALTYSFVKDIPFYSPLVETNTTNRIKIVKEELNNIPVNYGFSDQQIKMLSGEFLQENGYLGENILIAILDAGFTNANSISSLQHLWDNDQIITYNDFVRDGSNFFKTNDHGTFVLSIIGGVEEDIIFGSAPGAEFILIRTEKDPTEYIIEEYNWVCGAEFADSIGADLINSSLGYNEFDDPQQNHSYNDMDGETCVSSIGASIASSKGILVVASAGNEGKKSWHWIGTPADADNILTVGAVDTLELVTDFSSRGPSYDQRNKPDVCALGKGTFGQKPSGGFYASNGTSLSAPLITGLSACLWQANPLATNMQLIDAIRQSSSFYTNPNNDYGYGIPDFAFADRILKRELSQEEESLYSFYMYPNPATDYLNIEIYQNQSSVDQSIKIICFDISGRIVFIEESQLTSEISLLNLKNIDRLSTGAYHLMIELSERFYSLVFVKI